MLLTPLPDSSMFVYEGAQYFLEVNVEGILHGWDSYTIPGFLDSWSRGDSLSRHPISLRIIRLPSWSEKDSWAWKFTTYRFFILAHSNSVHPGFCRHFPHIISLFLSWSCPIVQPFSSLDYICVCCFLVLNLLWSSVDMSTAILEVSNRKKRVFADRQRLNRMQSN